MSVRVFRWILVITNLILILIPITALVLSYFFLIPKVLDSEIDRATATLSAAFTIWAVVLILTSICFLGITFTNSCCLHLISALLLASSAALSSWLVTDQFLNHETPNWTLVTIAAVAAFIWTIQVFTELLLSCILCCRPSSPKNDAEAAKKAEAEDHHNKKGRSDDGTDEEKEKLVLYQHESHNNHSHGHGQGGTTTTSGPGGAFVPSPQAPPIEEVDEGEDDDDDDDEDEDEEEADSQAGIRMIDRNNPNHPHDLALRSIPEEKQHLLHGIGSSGSGLRPMSRSSQGSGGQQCPLATPEDTGV